MFKILFSILLNRMTYFKTFPPCPELAEIVDFYWRSIITLSESLSQEVPTPLMQGMTFNLNALAEDMIFPERKLTMKKYCYLFGQPVKPRISLSNPRGIDILGVKFKAMGIHRLTGLNMRYLADDIIEADSVWGNEVELLCEQMYEASGTGEMIWMLEKFLTGKLRQQQKKRNNLAMAGALELMGGKKFYTLKAIQEMTFTSKKTLERYFLDQVGLPPKRYARICRFNLVKNMFDQQPGMNWQEIAFQLGYYDQSHFIKEFKEFSGKTPNEYCASRLLESSALF
ncbi:helix-turn-helix domain-containing protein [Anseongella ginsenosidimutans]|nr:helix-turn-helix domain-containing protein [Anseongella ginsenosidimutans]